VPEHFAAIHREEVLFPASQSATDTGGWPIAPGPRPTASPRTRHRHAGRSPRMPRSSPSWGPSTTAPAPSAKMTAVPPASGADVHPRALHFLSHDQHVIGTCRAGRRRRRPEARRLKPLHCIRMSEGGNLPAPSSRCRKTPFAGEEGVRECSWHRRSRRGPSPSLQPSPWRRHWHAFPARRRISPGRIQCRSRMPVRSLIHSSVVSIWRKLGVGDGPLRPRRGRFRE
jgi:hypothetical protein